MARRVARGYKACERFPVGTVVSCGTGSSVRRWALGEPVGRGGFGDIYSARLDTASRADCPYVVKLEPHGNGPLFVEMHFYMRNAKQEDVNEFLKQSKLKSLGMPIYIASGSHEYNGNKYRFVVMERYGKDLWHRFLENDRIFPTHTVFRIAIQMLHVYEYIHGRTYVHGDLKGANILFGLSKSTENQAFLVDFGLACHYSIKEYKKDPKKAHNGTIEYTSRDAHNGVSTRRGDMEILAYNIVQWLTGSLPWETDLRHPANVQAQKEKYMSDIPSFLKKTFTKSSPPSAVTSFLQYVSKMEYDETPDYKKCRQMFERGLKLLGYSINCNLDFTPVKSAMKSPKTKKKILEDDADFDDVIDDSKTKKVAKKTKPVLKAKLEPESSKRKRIEKTKNDTSRSTESSEDIILPSDVSEINDSINCSSPTRVLRRNKSPKNYNETASSVDIFEDSCIETPPKLGVKRKHTKKFEVEYCTDEEVTVHTVVKRKGGVVKEQTKSWKKCPTIVNGRSAQTTTS